MFGQFWGNMNQMNTDPLKKLRSERLFPFCSRNIGSDNIMKLATQCLPCNIKDEIANEANVELYTYMSSRGKCNQQVTEYPLPLVKCGECNTALITAVFICLVFTCIWTVVVNLWSILVWTSNKRFKRSQIYFKISHAFSNFLFGLIVLPCACSYLYYILFTGHEEIYDFAMILNRVNYTVPIYYKNWENLFTTNALQFVGAVFVTVMGADIASFLLMSVDRYLALSLSLR